MKQILVIPFVVILSALLGYAALRGFGWRPYAHELLATGIASLIAGMTAIVPPLLQRPHGQAAVVQGAFHGMLAHFGLMLLLCLAAYIAAGPKRLAMIPFALWAMWFFFVTLTVVSGSLIRLIRTTPIETTSIKP